jgi:hypothetical protein
MIGVENGRLVLNESIDDLFRNNEGGKKRRFSKFRI